MSKDDPLAKPEIGRQLCAQLARVAPKLRALPRPAIAEAANEAPKVPPTVPATGKH